MIKALKELSVGLGVVSLVGLTMYGFYEAFVWIDSHVSAISVVVVAGLFIFLSFCKVLGGAILEEFSKARN